MHKMRTYMNNTSVLIRTIEKCDVSYALGFVMHELTDAQTNKDTLQTHTHTHDAKLKSLHMATNTSRLCR